MPKLSETITGIIEISDLLGITPEGSWGAIINKIANLSEYNYNIVDKKIMTTLSVASILQAYGDSNVVDLLKQAGITAIQGTSIVNEELISSALRLAANTGSTIINSIKQELVIGGTSHLSHLIDNSVTTPFNNEPHHMNWFYFRILKFK